MGENLPEDYAADLIARSIVPFMGIAEAMDAAEAAAFIGEHWKHPSSPPVGGRGGPAKPGRRGGACDALPNFPLSDALRAPPLPLVGGEDERQPSEAGAKSLLAGCGLPVPPGRKVPSPEDAVDAAKELGFPVALKALGVAHKSEHGAVRLNLASADAVKGAARDLLPLGTGLYVEKMVTGGLAELIVGITHDPLFGPVMTVGSGGVLVELLQDSATLLLPVGRDEIEAALRGLKLFPLLDGYRGRLKADLSAAVDAILGIASFALENADAIEELDINPLIVCRQGEGAWIADALLVLASVDAKEPAYA
jgi:acyl-CoA synthetase (NDP forming)